MGKTKAKSTSLVFNTSTFQPKHLELIENAQMDLHKFILASGGIRSGKSVTLAAIVLYRAMLAPNSRHLVCHAFANICKQNLFDLTFPQTIEIVLGRKYWDYLKNEMDRGSPKYVRLSDREIILPNGSKIMFRGLDDPEKIRGQEYSTIWVNEANVDIDYQTITTLRGRLSESVDTLEIGEDGKPFKLATKMLFDLNPKAESSWEYQLFVRGVVPGDGSPLPADYAKRHYHISINASDNLANLPPDYADDFASMTHAQRLRDELGQWSVDNPNALFNYAQMQRVETIDINDMVEIIVAVDPATTSNANSDQTGIVVSGRGEDGFYYVIEDATMKAKPEQWAKKVASLSEKYMANRVIAEKNQGGDMVASVLRAAGVNVKIDLVHAVRGKELRAEPVSVLYENAKVFHKTGLRDLEQQMTEFKSGNRSRSPDRVDALVYALTHLSKQSKRSASLSQHNLWS